MNKKLLYFLALLFSGCKLGAQCIAINNCPNNELQLCEPLPNSPLFWNEPYWEGPGGLPDLPEISVGSLNVQAMNFCPGGDLSFQYLLFLDLDDDGVWETVVNSANLPPYNTVYFGNAGNPNYSGGMPRAFDERPVPANQKYGFAIEATGSGASQQAVIQWNTQQAPGTFEDPKLPVGHHKVRWIVTDSLGNQAVCEYLFDVKNDCDRPTIVCENGLSVNILPNLMVQLTTTDFLFYVGDNVTPTNLIQLGLRKVGTGTGFPLDSLGIPIQSISYGCDELGIQFVELWAIDEAGNDDFCETYLYVQDNLMVCGSVGTVQPADLDLRVQAAPNPFRETLTLHLQTDRASGLSIRLCDPTGREIVRLYKSVGSGRTSLDIPASNLPPGLYFLAVENDLGKVKFQKINKL